MTATKQCVKCKETIDAAAKHCEHCGAPQARSALRHTEAMSAVDPALLGLSADPAAAGGASGQKRSVTGGHPSQTNNTLFSLEDAARDAVAAAETFKAEQADADAEDTLVDPPRSGDDPDEPASDGPGRRLAEKWRFLEVSWAFFARSVMVLGGLVLLSVFIAGSALLPTLGGVQLVLSMYYLAGGLMLVGGGVLPLPSKLRSAFATVAGAVPLFVAAPLVGDLGGWRGLAAALVFLVLPGALLLRARVADSRLARSLVLGAVVVAVLIYLVPADGVLPITIAFGLIASGSLANLLAGLFFLAPLVLALLTLTSFVARETSGLGNLWAGLVLLTAAGAIVLSGLARDELSLVHLGVGLLAAGSAAAVGVAQLLDLDSRAA